MTGACAAPCDTVRADARAGSRGATGPRTAAGKARAAQNARRHGLAVPVMHDPALAKEVETLARAIAGAAAPAMLVAAARRIAEAAVDLARVRRARLCVLSHAGGEGGLAARLARLDRYERRCRSRRKFALRAYDAARHALADEARTGSPVEACTAACAASRAAALRRSAPHRDRPVGKGTARPGPARAGVLAERTPGIAAPRTSGRGTGRRRGGLWPPARRPLRRAGPCRIRPPPCGAAHRPAHVGGA